MHLLCTASVSNELRERQLRLTAAASSTSGGLGKAGAEGQATTYSSTQGTTAAHWRGRRCRA